MSDTPRFPRRAVVITPSDVTLMVPTTVYVGVTGNVAVEPFDNEGVAVTFVAVPAGSVVPVQVRRVLATGTTATSLLGIR